MFGFNPGDIGPYVGSVAPVCRHCKNKKGKNKQHVT